MARITGTLTVTAKAYGRPVTLRWRDGELEGDSPFDQAVAEDVRGLVSRGITVSDGAALTGPATLEDGAAPELILATIAACVDEVTDVTGVEATDPPAGADV